MKFIGIIASIYILVLSASPCFDRDQCINENITTEAKGEHESHESEDSCSPFCICSCCGCQVSFFQNMSGFAILTSNAEVICIYQSAFINSFFAKIWQPPKIN